MSAVEYVIPADPGNGHAQWDEGKCPKCGAGTLIAWVNGTAYRHCSYVKCDWGLANDVIVASHNEHFFALFGMRRKRPVREPHPVSCLHDVHNPGRRYRVADRQGQGKHEAVVQSHPAIRIDADTGPTLRTPSQQGLAASMKPAPVVLADINFPGIESVPNGVVVCGRSADRGVGQVCRRVNFEHSCQRGVVWRTKREAHGYDTATNGDPAPTSWNGTYPIGLLAHTGMVAPLNLRWRRALTRLPLLIVLLTVTIREGTTRGELALGVLLAIVIAAATFGVMRWRRGPGWWRAPQSGE